MRFHEIITAQKLYEQETATLTPADILGSDTGQAALKKALAADPANIGKNFFQNRDALPLTIPPNPNMNMYQPHEYFTAPGTGGAVDPNDDSYIDVKNFNTRLNNEKIGLNNASIYANTDLFTGDEFRDKLGKEADELQKHGGPASMPMPNYITKDMMDQYERSPSYQRDLQDWQQRLITIFPHSKYPGVLPMFQMDDKNYYDFNEWPFTEIDSVPLYPQYNVHPQRDMLYNWYKQQGFPDELNPAFPGSKYPLKPGDIGNSWKM